VDTGLGLRETSRLNDFRNLGDKLRLDHPSEMPAGMAGIAAWKGRSTVGSTGEVIQMYLLE